MAISIPAQLGDTASSLAGSAADVASTLVSGASDVVGDVLQATLELGAEAAETAATAARGAGEAIASAAPVIAGAAPPVVSALRRHPLAMIAVAASLVVAVIMWRRHRAGTETSRAMSRSADESSLVGTAA
jgi:hypothetical protein